MAFALFGGGDDGQQGQPAAAAAAKKRILLCEDDKFFSQAISLILGSSGYEVVHAPDGQQGVNILNEQKNIDLILCDIMMPVLDGFGVIKQVKAMPDYSGTPFIFLTGVSDFTSMDRATELGAKDYFIKANTDLPKIVGLVQKYI